MQPRLQTNGVPVVGTAGMTIKRAAGSGAPIAAPSRPFYELEDDEADEVGLPGEEPILPPVLDRTETPVAASPVLPAVAAPAALPELPLAPPEPAATLAPPPEPEPEPPAPKIIEPEPLMLAVIAEPEPKPEPAPAPKPGPTRKKPPLPTAAPKAPLGATAAAEERMIRYRTLGNNDVALLDRLFTADVPGIIAHYVMISSIACAEAGDEPEAGGYPAFLRRACRPSPRCSKRLPRRRVRSPKAPRFRRTARNSNARRRLAKPRSRWRRSAVRLKTAKRPRG